MDTKKDGRKNKFAEALKARSVCTFTKKYCGPLFALIIGINKYSFSPLRGAVPDADAISNFLTMQLGVPHENITNLRDKEATRARIISELEKLAKRKDIPRNAAILIYYAGHGSTMAIPRVWPGYQTADGEIEGICPVDIQTRVEPTDNLSVGSTRGYKIESGLIPMIPDRVLNCLIHEISEAHGNNIVTIFDCCHSGGLSRDLDPMSDRPKSRHMPNPPPLLEGTDMDILGRSNSLTFNVPGDISAYVHIAAVSRTKRAEEGTNLEEKLSGGYFTTFLLEVLKSSPTAIEELSYKTLINQVYERMKNCFGSFQQPQCEGVHINRRIFSVDIRGRLITGTWDESANTMRIEAGVAHGVGEDSKFAIFRDDTGVGSPLINEVGVQDLGTDNTRLRLPRHSGTKLPKTFYAKRIPAERVKVLIQDNELVSALYAKSDFSDRLGIEVTDKAGDQHDLRIAVEDGQIVFYWGGENLFTEVLNGRIPRTLPLEEKDRLLPVIRAFATFKHHLMRISDTGEEELKKYINVDLKKITGGLVKATTGNDLLGEDNHVPIRSKDGSDSLCFTIHHCLEGSPALYLYILYFSSCLGIWPIFFPEHIANPDKAHAPTVKYGGKFQIGFGDGGKPMKFILPEGIDKDLGYLKIFLTTKPVDFYPLVQESPFDVEQENNIGTLTRSSNLTPSSRAMTQPAHDTTRVLRYHNLLERGMRPIPERRTDLLEVARLNTIRVYKRTSHDESDVGTDEAAWGAIKYAVIQKRTSQ
ncbi:hypothetical protein HYPSUDRAFT_48284 [Hypholoma sublateritium FD-334 SS-4]|uniref:Peptidase C14 caspase domain-containing protein n=1 Tax=Hypholoma sublateritium (strain FD-334 SS-4) TaxID=945553 RepID=A0A0D2NFR2_HYPSF|nr:hypothetical protein HYPSUDRAFT_48284 [Hypholoma sublateritium FD-334 SS-4]